MLGLNIYSYVEDNDVPLYKIQRSLPKKMDMLNWIHGSYFEEILEEGENPLDMARRINLEENAMKALINVPKPLVRLHPGNRPWQHVAKWRRRRREKRRTKNRRRWRMGQLDSRRNLKPPNGRKLSGWQLHKVRWCPSPQWTMRKTCIPRTRLPCSGRRGG